METTITATANRKMNNYAPQKLYFIEQQPLQDEKT